jgi:hypothetical protein
MSQDRTNSPSSLPRPDFFSEALRRADSATVIRPARRTFAEMLPGATRQPVLHLAPHIRFRANNERCLFCDSWTCDGVSCQSHAPAPAGVSVKAAA